mgnify:CR=1 FL=1
MLHHLAINHWRDAIEIIFFAGLFYHLARWLQHDKTKNLLPYFYGSCLVMLTAYTLNLPTVLACMFIFAPSLVAVFILLHQDTLQRNIVALKNIIPTQTTKTDWQHVIIKTALLRLNEHKELRCIIACTDDITPFVQTPFSLATPIVHSTINLLLASPSFNATAMLWCDAHGTIRGLNTTWKENTDDKKIGAHKAHDAWQTQCQFFTKKTDAFALRLDPETRLFTVIKGGILLEGVPAHHVQQLLRKHVGTLAAPLQAHTQRVHKKQEKGKINE